MIQGIITEEEGEALKSKHITKITSDKYSYDYCIEMKDALNNDNENDSDSKNSCSKNSKASICYESNNTGIEHYYCYNDEKKLLDYVLIRDSHFDVVEILR